MNETNNPNTENSTKTVGSKARNPLAILAIIIPAIILLRGWYTDFSGDYYYCIPFKYSDYIDASIKYGDSVLYMHKDKECCKKVADHYGLSITRIKADQKAGTNYYGQTVHYKDILYYCPLCFG